MAAPATSDTELVTEHFGYPLSAHRLLQLLIARPSVANLVQSLIDDIINSINILAERALNSVEQGLLNLPPATLGFKPARKQPALDPEAYAEQAKAEIETGTHQLETLLTTNIDRNFDKLELYVLRNIFSVKPPDLRNYIRLTHYGGLDFSSATATEVAAVNGEEGQQQQSNTHGVNSDKPTLESIGQLRKKLRESMRLNALLHAEQERNARLVSDLRGLLGMTGDVKTEETHSSQEPGSSSEQPAAPLAFLHQKVGSLRDAGPDTPLSTTTAFTLSQLQALRALSTSLRTMGPDLAPTPNSEAEGEPMARRRRGGRRGGASGLTMWRARRGGISSTCRAWSWARTARCGMGSGRARAGSSPWGKWRGWSRWLVSWGGEVGASTNSRGDGQQEEEEDGEAMDES
ncbi:hypothetical protein PG996_000285 [Apiospora saccharicola]|uniref:Kinetochore-associated protein MTW1 n=1 Tax=Apiospora saccharicola TaxID=335842 RepID=A0ABR1WDB7_9PEZI